MTYPIKDIQKITRKLKETANVIIQIPYIINEGIIYYYIDNINFFNFGEILGKFL